MKRPLSNRIKALESQIEDKLPSIPITHFDKELGMAMQIVGNGLIVPLPMSENEWSQWSNRQIAKHCHVSDVFVGNLRKKIDQEGANVCTFPPKPALNLETEEKLSTGNDHKMKVTL